MVTALTVYGTNAASTTLSTARGLVSVTGASGNGVPTTKIGTSTGWGEVYSAGTTNAWQAGGSEASVVPSGNGWLFDTTILEGQQIVSGTWTATIQVAQSVQTSNSTMDFYIRAYKLAADLATYTLIGDMSLTAQSVSTTLTTYTLTGSSLPAMNFGTGDKLYLHDLANITINNTGSTSATLKWTNSNSATQGRAGNMQVVTPGYNAVVTSSIQITDAGVNMIRNGNSGANNPLISYVALGTGNTAPTAADTQLVNEVFRKKVTSYANGATGEILITGYFSSTDAVGLNIAEIGFFGGSSANAAANTGVLMARGLYTLSGKTNSEAVQAVIDLTYTHL